MGNAFGLVFLTLPIGIADPARRLRAIQKEIDELKGSPEARRCAKPRLPQRLAATATPHPGGPLRGRPDLPTRRGGERRNVVSIMHESPVAVSETEALDAYSSTVTAVAQRVLPAVASLRVRRSSRSFDGGAGSGVVITPDGFLVTSAHVVAQAGAATASFIDGSEYELDVVGADPLSDLAIARARAAKLEPIQIGNADNLRVGQLVVAIGNPLGFSGSVTSGVVSGLGRSLATADGNGHRRFIEDVIQTDAALNPGNSGGALADWQARLVGVNTAVAGMGLGLAVPINKTTQAILAALMRSGRVRRAFLGIAGGTRPLPPAIAQRLGRKAGVEVQEVVAGSPAAASLRGGDIIVSVGDVPVGKAGDLQRLMVEAQIGSKLGLSILRGGRLMTLEVVPVELA
jgi:S1-C subfamily serine protease